MKWQNMGCRFSKGYIFCPYDFDESSLELLSMLDPIFVYIFTGCAAILIIGFASGDFSA
jgi:hypothetical protein